LIICILIIVFFVLISFPFVNYIQKKRTTSIDITDLYLAWNNAEYKNVYDLATSILQNSPFNNAALTFKGYAAFYLSVSQSDSLLAQNYLDEAINSMRVALLSVQQSVRPQLMYMLGKSYFYKNTLSSYHYYSDLVIYYLNLAREEGFEADDIPELLGLSYASLNMTQESIAAFTEALIARESDILLLSIAEQYYKNEQFAAAKAYLHRVKTETINDELRFKSSALLGQIFLHEENYDEAEKEFLSILKNDPTFADAYYGLGVIYENQGNLVKARAEWRKALRMNVEHQGALQKLAEYK